MAIFFVFPEKKLLLPTPLMIFLRKAIYFRDLISFCYVLIIKITCTFDNQFCLILSKGDDMSHYYIMSL